MNTTTVKPSHAREFSKYTALNILGMMGLSCYILADTFFVSKALGSVGLTALNLAIPAYNFIHGTGLLLGMGAATRWSILKASGSDQGDMVFTTAFRLTILLSLAFAALGLLGSAPLARLLGADFVTFEMTRTYLRILLLFSPLFMMNDLLLCFVRNDDAPGLAMGAMLAGSFSNILLDYIFMFPLQLGIFGAVLATGFAPAISMMILSPHLLKKRNSFHLSRATVSQIPTIVSIGLPSLIAEVSSGIVIIAFNIIILTLSGNIGVAAYGVVANLSLVVVSIYTGLAQGVQPLLSRSHGHKDFASIRSFLRYALITTAILSAVIYSGLFFGADTVASIFNSEGDPQLQSMAIDGLRLYFTACPFVGTNLVLSVYLTCTDKARPAGVLSSLRGFLLILPLAFVMATIWNMTGLWLAFPVTELIVFLLGLFLMKRH
ncbi:MAG: MATE family efflux transporter [Firmicutes bacterium]|nr:MATE family efflux transporter [Bacillota bacterium]